MSDEPLVLEILGQILNAIERIERRFVSIKNADDFLKDDHGLDMLDAICMMLIAIGESLKQIDKISDRKLLDRYTKVDWKGAKGVRDIISHKYFDVDAEIVFSICQDHLSTIKQTILEIVKDLRHHISTVQDNQ
jgi:uncharacterized protein with HEPN domain